MTSLPPQTQGAEPAPAPENGKGSGLTWRGCPRLLQQTAGPFLLGLLFGPAAVVLHEGGHYLAALVLGFRPHLHFALTSFAGPEPTALGTNFCIAVAGPAVNAVCLLAGFLWLWQRRRHRLQAPVSLLDWVATIPILGAGRWLSGVGRTAVKPQSYDEAMASVLLGLPKWVLPYVLAAAALVLLVWALRLHPPGSRWLPWTAAGVGCWIGLTLWLMVLGPRVLP